MERTNLYCYLLVLSHQKILYIGVVGVKNAQYEILVYESNEAMIEPDDSFDVQLTSTEPYEIRFKQDTSVNSKKMMFTFYSKDKLSITFENQSKEVKDTASFALYVWM